jgi:hypothetical protein
MKFNISNQTDNTDSLSDYKDTASVNIDTLTTDLSQEE